MPELQAAAPARAGLFSGVPTFIKDNVDVAGLPTMRGTDAWPPRPAEADSDFARMYLATGVTPLGKTQMSEYGFSASAEHPRLGPVRNPWNTDHTAGASSSGSGCVRRRRALSRSRTPTTAADRFEFPRRATDLSGSSRPAAGYRWTKKSGRCRFGVVANGVVSRSVRDTAAFYAEAERIWPTAKLPPIGHVRHAGTRRLRIAVVTRSLLRESSPEVRELTLKSAALLEELGHRVDYLEKPPVPASFVSDFVLYWGLLAMGQIQQNKRALEGFDVTRLDNLTRGLDRHARRNLHRLPLALIRLSRTRRYTARLARTYDVVMTPTLADETPQIGYLDPMADYQQIIDRLQEWVAFTPLQNVTGEPAISLPLALSANGLPVGTMFSAPIGHEARLLELAYELEDARPWARIDRQA